MLSKESHGLNNPICYLCKSNELDFLGVVTKKPLLEPDFKLPKDKYKRFIFHCKNCSAYNNLHYLLSDDFYKGEYNVNAHRGSIAESYNRIMSLPYSDSDNKQRVSRIINYLKNIGKEKKQLKVLDIGSGLCVFLGEMMKHGIEAYCVDPDPEAVKHAKEVVKVDGAFNSNVEDLSTTHKFDLITFNKVLEHVADPIQILSLTKSWLAKNGIVYIEVPDGKAAIENDGFENREEFFIDHCLIFDEKSVNYLIEQAGFFSREVKSIYEPSTKYTTFSFLSET